MSNIAGPVYGGKPKPHTPQWFFSQSGDDPEAYCERLFMCHEAGLVNFSDEVRASFSEPELPATFRRDLFHYCDKNWNAINRRLADIRASLRQWELLN